MKKLSWRLFSKTKKYECPKCGKTFNEKQLYKKNRCPDCKGILKWKIENE